MWIYISVPLLAYLNAVASRDVGKTLKTMPFVTNSLVNLGKMDISFHFNVQPQDFASRVEGVKRFNSILSPKIESTIEEPCPCSSLSYLKDTSQLHSSDLLSRILSGNDLFSSKEPSSSPLCCDSHEHVTEDVLLEFGPKQSQIIANPQISNSFPFLPFLLEGLKSRPTMPITPSKQKAVEIFLFPKKRGILSTEAEKAIAENKNNIKTNIIKVVGDKQIKNDFKTHNFVPAVPSSIKKDLALQEKHKYTQANNEVKWETVMKAKELPSATDRHLNIVV